MSTEHQKTEQPCTIHSVVRSLLLKKPSTCGWHFDSDFLRAVTKKAKKHDPLISMEQVEYVLRALSEQ